MDEDRPVAGTVLSAVGATLILVVGAITVCESGTAAALGFADTAFLLSSFGFFGILAGIVLLILAFLL